MNSPQKSQISNKSLTLKSKADLAKLHCVLNLFGGSSDIDPFYVRSIKEAIDASLVEEGILDDSIGLFAEAALRLIAESPHIQSSYGLFHLDLSEKGFDPLFIHQELIRGLKRIAGYQRTLLVVTGLRMSILGMDKYFTRAKQRQYDEALHFIDDLTGRWTSEFTETNILYV